MSKWGKKIAKRYPKEIKIYNELLISSLSYGKLEKIFHSSVEQLQKSCKCIYKKISLTDNGSGIGCGSLYASIEAFCQTCNKEYIIFRGDRNISKRSPKIKKIINKMIKNNYFRCWLEDKSQGNDKPIFEERQ